MKCDRNHLRIVTIDDETYGVIGCGQRLTYVERCTSPYEDACTWVLNSDTRRERKGDE